MFARASSVGRVVECPASAILPLAPEDRSESLEEAADWGTYVHQWVATGDYTPPADHPSWEGLLKRRVEANGGEGLRDVWWPNTGKHEVCYGISLEDPRKWATFQGTKAQVEAWSRSLPGSFIKGEADYVGEVQGRLWVDDLKTGKIPPPPKNPQNRTYVLGAWLSHPERQRYREIATSITHWPRYPVEGGPVRTWAVFRVDELKAWYLRLQSAYNRVSVLRRLPTSAAVLTINPGDHCLYCPAQCPAKTKQ